MEAVRQGEGSTRRPSGWQLRRVSREAEHPGGQEQSALLGREQDRVEAASSDECPVCSQHLAVREHEVGRLVAPGFATTWPYSHE